MRWQLVSLLLTNVMLLNSNALYNGGGFADGTCETEQMVSQKSPAIQERSCRPDRCTCQTGAAVHLAQVRAQLCKFLAQLGAISLRVVWKIQRHIAPAGVAQADAEGLLTFIRQQRLMDGLQARHILRHITTA